MRATGWLRLGRGQQARSDFVAGAIRAKPAPGPVSRGCDPDRDRAAPKLHTPYVMQPFPHRYRIDVIGDGAHARLDASGPPAVVGGAPPEFDGDADVWSPEQLLLASVGLCLFTTFRAIAARGAAPMTGYSFQDRVEGILAKTAQGPRFSEITHHVELRVAAADRERAAQLLATAERHCIISNSLNMPVRVVSAVSSLS